MANPAVEGTPLCRHKGTFHTLFNSCTNQWNHLLFILFKNKKPGIYSRLGVTEKILRNIIRLEALVN